MISVKRWIAGAACAALTTSLVSRAGAQNEPYEELTVKHYPERVFNGHTFLTPTFFPTAFIATSFALRQSVVYVKIPDFPLSESTVRDVEMLGQNERLEVAVRLFDRLQLFALLGGEAYIGSNVESVIVGGTSFAYTLGAGAAVRLFRLPTTGTQLSVRAQGSYGPGGVIDLLRLLEAVVATDPQTAQQVVEQNQLRELVLRDTERAEGSLEILLAQSFTRTFGLQASLGATYAHSTLTFFDSTRNRDVTTDTNKLSPEAAVAFGANLDPIAPLGFLAEYSLRAGRRNLPGSEVVDTKISHAVAVGVHLVHPQFQIGLTFAETLSVEPVTRLDSAGVRRTSGTPLLSSAQLGLEFTW